MSRYYLLGAIICFLTAIIVVIVVAAQIHPTRSADPFEPVRMFMPGQSVNVVAVQPNCQTYMSMPYDDGYHYYCVFKDGPFSIASMTLDYHTDTVKTLYLSVRSRSLQVGDLLHWFEVTRKIGRGSIKTLVWDGGHAWCWVRRGHFLSIYTYLFGIWLEKPVVKKES